jgi:hypothetical protein
MTSVEQASESRRCAVIYNPTKISDKFDALMCESLQREGWRDRCQGSCPSFHRRLECNLMS